MSIDWKSVKRVLVIRLRSIGDTVLATPSLIALRRFLPDAQIDILLEDWVAPVLEGFGSVDNVLPVAGSNASRFSIGREIRRRKYDVVFNLHGGTTSTFLTFATGAKNRIGYKHYQYSFLHNHLIGSSADFWKREKVHSAEQQLALFGSVGIPVDDRPRSMLVPTTAAAASLDEKFRSRSQVPVSDIGPFALIHPTAAFETKQWASENFAQVADFLHDRGIASVAVAAENETSVLENMQASRARVHAFDNLTLPEITALASKASLFVGNDSGIAHMASAVATPSVVIFGSSNRDHWRPWTDAPNEIVFEEFACQPCPGHECREFGEPRCILSVKPVKVFEAIDRVLKKS